MEVTFLYSAQNNGFFDTRVFAGVYCNKRNSSMDENGRERMEGRRIIKLGGFC